MTRAGTSAFFVVLIGCASCFEKTGDPKVQDATDAPDAPAPADALPDGADAPDEGDAPVLGADCPDAGPAPLLEGLQPVTDPCPPAGGALDVDFRPGEVRTLAVRLVKDGQPVPGAEVTWALPSGPFGFTEPASRTGLDGVAAKELWAGPGCPDGIVHAVPACLADGTCVTFQVRVVEPDRVGATIRFETMTGTPAADTLELRLYAEDLSGGRACRNLVDGEPPPGERVVTGVAQAEVVELADLPRAAGPYEVQTGTLLVMGYAGDLRVSRGCTSLLNGPCLHREVRVRLDDDRPAPLRWSLPLFGSVSFDQLVVGDDGAVTVMTKDGYLGHLAADGELLWEGMGEGKVSYAQLLLLPDGTVVVAGSGSLEARNRAGKVAWTWTGQTGALAVGATGRLYTGAAVLVAVDAPGTNAWEWAAPAPLETCAIGTTGRLYCVDREGALHALDDSGSAVKRVWSSPAGGAARGEPVPVTSLFPEEAEHLLVPRVDRLVHIVARDGAATEDWSVPANGLPVVAAAGIAYASADGDLLAIDVTNGAVRWRLHEPHVFFQSDWAALDAAGRLYVAAMVPADWPWGGLPWTVVRVEDDGIMGRVTWVSPGESAFGSAPAMSAAGALVWPGNGDLRSRPFDVGVPSRPHPWPRTRGDNGNRRQSR